MEYISCQNDKGRFQEQPFGRRCGSLGIVATGVDEAVALLESRFVLLPEGRSDGKSSQVQAASRLVSVIRSGARTALMVSRPTEKQKASGAMRPPKSS